MAESDGAVFAGQGQVVTAFQETDGGLRSGPNGSGVGVGALGGAAALARPSMRRSAERRAAILERRYAA